MSQSNVIALYSHFFYIFQFMGLTSFAIRKNWCSAWYKKYQYIHFSMVIVILVYSLTFLVNDNLNYMDEKLGALSKIYVVVAMLQLSGHFFASLTAIISAFLKSNIEEKIFLKIDKIDELIKKEFFVETLTRNFKFLVFMIAEVILFLTRSTLRFNMFGQSNYYYTFYLLHVFTILITKLFFVKYYIFLELLKYRVQMFTDIIEKFKSHQNKNTSTMQLKTIKRVHSLILDIVAMINECFGLSLLMFFIVLFISLTNKTYILYLSIYNIFEEIYVIGEYFYLYFLIY